MTTNYMEGLVKFDRKIDKNKHYISLGGFEVKVKGKDEPIGFDFECLEAGIEADDPTKLSFLLRGIDLDTFPESEYLLTHLNEIEEFTEFFIYTGESDGEEIIPVEVEDISITFGENTREFTDEECLKIPIQH